MNHEDVTDEIITLWNRFPSGWYDPRDIHSIAEDFAKMMTAVEAGNQAAVEKFAKFTAWRMTQ